MPAAKTTKSSTAKKKTTGTTKKRTTQTGGAKKTAVQKEDHIAKFKSGISFLYAGDAVNALYSARPEELETIAQNLKEYSGLFKFDDATIGKIFDVLKPFVDSKTAEFKESFTKALNENDADAISKCLENVTDLQYASIGMDNSLVAKVVKLDKNIASPILDKIFHYINDVDLLRDAVDTRFSVKLGSDRMTGTDKENALDFLKSIHSDYSQYTYSSKEEETEQKWTQAAVQRLYAVYLNIPEDFFTRIKGVITTNSTNGGGGLARYWQGIYMVNSNRSTIDQTDIVTNSGNVSSTEDSRYQGVTYDFNVAHEFGHVIDYQNGKKSRGKSYSDCEDFQQLSGWKGYVGTPAVLEAIKGAFVNPYFDQKANEPEKTDEKSADADKTTVAAKKTTTENKKTDDEKTAKDTTAETEEKKKNVIKKLPITEDEKTVYDDVATEMLNAGQYSDTLKEASIEKVLHKEDMVQKLAAAGKTAEDFRKSAPSSMLLTHIERGFYSRSPFFHEKFSNMNYQIHQDYASDNKWWSYSNDAWDEKVSRYEFSNPCEEFAELYASYFVTGDGSKTPKRLLGWFKQNVIDDKVGRGLEPKKEEKENP